MSLTLVALGRTVPSSLPAWLVVLDCTLGCKQGTLFKAPRNAERPLADVNAFSKCDFWNFLSCKPTVPMPVSHSFTQALMKRCIEVSM